MFIIFVFQKYKPRNHFFYIWPEFTGRKGAAEIYSCVYKYLQDHVLCKPNYPKKLRIYADNCGGQNKNNKIVLALLRLVHLGLFDRIELAFLVAGHSYMPCDRQFGIISNRLKRYQKISSPDTLVDFIRRVEGEEPVVVKMERKDIFNVDVFTETDLDKRVAKIRREDKVFSQASIIVMKWNVPNGYLLKKN